jgi:hypothetical protein
VLLPAERGRSFLFALRGCNGRLFSLLEKLTIVIAATGLGSAAITCAPGGGKLFENELLPRRKVDIF